MEMVTDSRKKRMATAPMSILGGGGDLGYEGGGGRWVPGCYHTSTERTREGADPISWGSWDPSTCAATLDTGPLWPMCVSLPRLVGGFVLRFFAMLSPLLWYALMAFFHNWGLKLHKSPRFSCTASWPPVVFPLALCTPTPPRFLQRSDCPTCCFADDSPAQQQQSHKQTYYSNSVIIKTKTINVFLRKLWLDSIFSGLYVSFHALVTIKIVSQLWLSSCLFPSVRPTLHSTPFSVFFSLSACVMFCLRCCKSDTFFEKWMKSNGTTGIPSQLGVMHVHKHLKDTYFLYDWQA